MYTSLFEYEEMGNVWVFVEGGLRVAPASLKTLVCPDRDATSLQLLSDEVDRGDRPGRGGVGQPAGDREATARRDSDAVRKDEHGHCH